jgi:hypothetical protein
MAAFNAQASVSLAVKPSKYHEAALSYFTGQTAVEDWQRLGMQGVADVAIRLSDKQVISAVAKNMANVPEQPFITFSTFLEHAEPTIVLVESLSQKLEGLLQAEQINITLVSACLRAVSNSPATGLVDQMVMKVLNHQEVGQEIEVLATISGRLWRILEQAELCQLFVERLAENKAGYSGFSQVLADAIYMPGLRESIMTALRSPERSQALTLRVGELFGQPSA